MQTSYKKELIAGIEGGLVYEFMPEQVLSRVGTTDIPFGRFVSYGGADDKCQLPGVGTDITGQGALLGISRRTQFIESAPVTNAQELSANYIAAIVPQYVAINVEKKGQIWMVTEQDATPTSSVYVRFQANGAATPGTLGCVRVDNDGGKAALAPNCRFLTSAKAGNLIAVDVDL